MLVNSKSNSEALVALLVSVVDLKKHNVSLWMNNNDFNEELTTALRRVVFEAFYDFLILVSTTIFCSIVIFTHFLVI